MNSLFTNLLPQRAKLRKILRLQDEVVRRTVVTPEDYMQKSDLDEPPEEWTDATISPNRNRADKMKACD